VSASVSFAVAWLAPSFVAFASCLISLALLVLGQVIWRLLDE